MASTALPKPAPSFYKRELPAQCIDFSSARGKELFSLALDQGGMESYFSLAPQMLTQDDPSYCGLGTLCMALNALGVDPQRQWKGAWRWYDQSMLDCCRPLEDIKKQGITLAEFVCLARCNGLSAKSTGGASGFPPQGLERFEQAVRHACSSSTAKALAISYSRKTLGQTGSGHFSLIGGYEATSRSVLILDVARFKYGIYWVTLELAYEAMQPPDSVSNLPRGYVVLTPTPASCCSSLGNSTHAKASSLLKLNMNKNTWSSFVRAVKLLHITSVPKDDNATILPLLATALAELKLGEPLARRSTTASETQDAELYEQRLSTLLDAIPTESSSKLLYLFALAASRAKPDVFGRWGESVQDGEGKGQVVEEADALADQLRNLDTCCQKDGKACAC